MVALSDANDGNSCKWAPSTVYTQVHPLTTTSQWYDAIFDMNGLGNTLRIKQTAEAATGNDFMTNAPAAYYAYYYDHTIQSTGTEPLGWYLPSAGEINLLIGSRTEVNSTLNKLSSYGAQPLNTGPWTSTARSATVVNVVNSDCGPIYDAGKTGDRKVRPITTF